MTVLALRSEKYVTFGDSCNIPASAASMWRPNQGLHTRFFRTYRIIECKPLICAHVIVVNTSQAILIRAFVSL